MQESLLRPSRRSHAIELTLFLWRMPGDATEGVAERTSKLQPSINLHAPVTTFMFSCSGTNVLPRKDEGSGKPYTVYRTSLAPRELILWDLRGPQIVIHKSLTKHSSVLPKPLAPIIYSPLTTC